jgi:hypothetical protein
MWIGPGVPQAFLTKPLENGFAARKLWGTNGRCDNLFFFFRKDRQGALANAKSLALKFRGNGIDALLLLLFKRFSAVSQTKLFRNLFSKFLIVFFLSMIKNTPVSHTLAVIRVYKLKNENRSKMHM